MCSRAPEPEAPGPLRFQDPKAPGCSLHGHTVEGSRLQRHMAPVSKATGSWLEAPSHQWSRAPEPQAPGPQAVGPRPYGSRLQAPRQVPRLHGPTDSRLQGSRVPGLQSSRALRDDFIRPVFFLLQLRRHPGVVTTSMLSSPKRSSSALGGWGGILLKGSGSDSPLGLRLSTIELILLLAPSMFQYTLVGLWLAPAQKKDQL